MVKGGGEASDSERDGDVRDERAKAEAPIYIDKLHHGNILAESSPMQMHVHVSQS